ncbi:shufflon protein C [Salmonella enterica subsp. enterica]|nr:shufflon protein C [Salmonella enterica subsp. enterica]HAF1587038.1 shufflon protein C [Salmonella enterica]
MSAKYGRWQTSQINFKVLSYNIEKNTRNRSICLHASCSWTHLNSSPLGGFQKVYSDGSDHWFVDNYVWDYESGGTITLTCLDLPGAGT